MNKTRFFDEQGLLKAKSSNFRDENGILFTLEYILLCNLKHIPCSNQKRDLEAAIDEMTVFPGIYAKTPYDLKECKIRSISHDNLTALVCFSKIMGLNTHKDIWSQICHKWFRYDNLNPENPGWRFLHPRDIIFYGMCSNFLWNLAFPLLFIIGTVTCLNNETSGKLLLLCRCLTLKDNKLMNLLYKWATFLIKLKFKSWNNVFKRYFPEIEHPNNVLSKEI